MSNSQTPEPGTERTLRSSVRNPRRRQRSDGDSVKTAPRRKRSKISENTFMPPREDEEEEEVNGTIEVTHRNGDIHPESSRGRPRRGSTPMRDLQIPLREKRNSVKRPARGDGATVLTQNSRYSVKLLPSTPKELRREGIEYRGSIDTAHHALAVTRERAYIWDYTSHAPVSSPRIFDIPFAVKPTEPLPLGALVTPGTGTDLGLILISATNGKVVFYESIERAASLGLFQERNTGVEGTLGGLFSGETVIDVVSADSAGFIITLSSGRIAQVTLRDAQGRARVFAQFLRATEQSSGGIFGSIKGILGGAYWKRDVTAVHTRSLGTRGQMQVISLTERAEVQIWDLDWSGQYNFKGTIDCKEVVTQELRKQELPETQGQAENVTALDFAILQKTSISNQIVTLGAEVPIELAVLLRNGTLDNCTYVLAELDLAGTEISVGQVIELDSYHPRASRTAQDKPRLLLPKPRHTAFVAFSDVIVVAAMEGPQLDGPDAQLHASYAQCQNFEDSVYLRDDGRFKVLSCCEEDSKTDQASSIAFIKGAGLVRISAVDPSKTDQQSRIPVKTKIEQAIFHGALQDGNIVDFSRVGDTGFSAEDVQTAALEISDDILSSVSAFISTDPTTMDAHLAYKAQALRALVTYVRQNYPALSKSAMWQLLWDAERVAAAQEMWTAFGEHVDACSQNKRTATVLDEVCVVVKQLLDRDKPNVESDNITVRDFLVNNLRHIEKVFPVVCQFLKDLSKETDQSPQAKLRLAIEANDIWNRSLEIVFNFRTEHAAAYGILPEFIDDGILTDLAEYTELPESWTSTEQMLKSASRMCNVSRQIASEEFDRSENDPEMKETALRLGQQNPRLIQILCQIYQERINWLASRNTDKDRDMSERLRVNYDSTRYDQFRALAEVAQSEAGLKLAEKYKDMNTLTEMIVAESQFTVECLNDQKTPESERPDLHAYLDQLHTRVGRYFERFGDDWANAYFDTGFSSGKPGLMFRDAQEHWQSALTKYLCADPSRAKLCWIDDITTNKDFAHAEECLKVAANEQETQLWAKKVELSMSKLALLATQEGLQAKGRGTSEPQLLKAMPSNDLAIVYIQESFYKHLLPEIVQCIDQQAELQVTMEKFALKNQDLHSLRRLLEAGMDRVLAHEALSAEELIDVLTLMDVHITDDVEDRNLQGAECYLALKVLNAAALTMPQGRVEMLLQIIWKRAYVYDDWVAINSAQKQSDEEVGQRLKQTVPWRTLYYAIDEGFFETPDCHVRHLFPSECLKAGCLPEDLEYRWPDPDILDPILHDNRIQDEQLQGYVEDRRLDEWIESCVESVKSTVQDEAEEKAEELRREREFEEESIEQANAHGTTANGHTKGPNGIKVEDDGEEHIFDQDEDEDVEME